MNTKGDIRDQRPITNQLMVKLGSQDTEETEEG